MKQIDSIIIPDKEFFSIGEVSKIVQVASYVLRYWESEFNLLRPARRISGQRKYTKKDIELIFKVKDLLYNKKFTIAGAKKHLIGDKRKKDTEQLNFDIKATGLDPKILIETKKELEEILKLLKS
jgi:DNA-binding transcriptional MerR regulator